MARPLFRPILIRSVRTGFPLALICFHT